MPHASPSFTPSFLKPQAQRELYDDRRGTSSERGYDHQWRKVRALKLAADPLCEQCEAEGVGPTIADMVHHIEPVDLRPDLRLALDNLMSLCWHHHGLIHQAD